MELLEAQESAFLGRIVAYPTNERPQLEPYYSKKGTKKCQGTRRWHNQMKIRIRVPASRVKVVPPHQALVRLAIPAVEVLSDQRTLEPKFSKHGFCLQVETKRTRKAKDL